MGTIDVQAGMRVFWKSCSSGTGGGILEPIEKMQLHGAAAAAFQAAVLARSRGACAVSGEPVRL